MRQSRFVPSVALVVFLTQLTACGLGSVATSTATEAAAQAEAAKNAKAMEDKIKRSIEASQQAAKQQIDDAEAETNK